LDIAFVVAMDRNRLIGVDEGLPWHLPDDMNWFVDKTMGKPVIMGRKTYESIPEKFRPLRGRHNIVLTRNPHYEAPGATVVHSLAAALAAAGNEPEVIIAGGARLYEQFFPQACRLYLTLIDAAFEGDAYFPIIDWDQWREVYHEYHPVDGRHSHAFTWLILERL